MLSFSMSASVSRRTWEEPFKRLSRRRGSSPEYLWVTCLLIRSFDHSKGLSSPLSIFSTDSAFWRVDASVDAR